MTCRRFLHKKQLLQSQLLMQMSIYRYCDVLPRAQFDKYCKDLCVSMYVCTAMHAILLCIIYRMCIQGRRVGWSSTKLIQIKYAVITKVSGS